MTGEWHLIAFFTLIFSINPATIIAAFITEVFMLIRLLALILINFHVVNCAEFTICSYNCGGLSDHYDYLRAAAMEKLMQERHVAEPEFMALNEKIQKVALKILFTTDSKERMLARQEWDDKGYQKIFEHLTLAPTIDGSINTAWNKKAEEMITTYTQRPVILYDEKVNQRLEEHLNHLVPHAPLHEQLQEGRKLMAKRIFANHLNYDIICLQEANYLDPSLFPENYQVLFAETTHSKNGIAWNKDRFELIDIVGNMLDKAFALQLRDKATGKSVLVASGHISGCNPFRAVIDPRTSILDSAKGDSELKMLVDLFDHRRSDLMLIGMDSNVTSLHPRLKILKEADYRIDHENHLDLTCTNPHQVLNTRIDWIALKSHLPNTSIFNIPVLSVGLNNLQINLSDHKPIAAKIQY
jgi:hypothetical protein